MSGVSHGPTRKRAFMTARIPLSRWTVARAYAVFAYACGVFLVWAAALVGQSHAAAWAVFIALPAIVFAALGPSIWSGERWAMIVAFVVIAVLEIATTVNSPGDWWVVVVFPLVCGAFTLAHIAAEPTSDDAPEPPARVADQVYAALAYIYGVVIAMVAPYDNLLEPPRVPVWALISGLMLGALSIFIWRGKVWAMACACLLTLAQWLVLVSFNPAYLTSGVYYAGPALAVPLTLLGVLTARLRST